MSEPEDLPRPELGPSKDLKKEAGTAKKSTEPKRLPKISVTTSRRARILSTVLLCVVSSVLTTWSLLAMGVIKPDASQTITENREKLVLQEGEIVADVFKEVSPSTVAITTQAAAEDGFFGSTVQEGAGSGIIISKDGYVLTNKHVIPTGTSKVTVVLADGREFNDVKVVGRDPVNDVAFLKIGGANDLPAASIGDSSNVREGQQVVAIGNALGEFRNSVTTGIISGIGRPVEASDGAGSSEKLENLFQTDTAINPGNSGGPLVNLQGDVIGINTAVAQQAEGIGFAIPINDAKGLIKTVLEQGKVVKPYLGVRYLGLTKESAKALNLPTDSGAYVSRNSQGNANAVIGGSPADKAGIREGDIIKKVNDKDINEDSTLAALLATFAPGDTATLTILRDGKEQKVQVTLEEFPQP